MDPIGFGFEMYDAIGRVRFVEAGQDVDSSGALTDTDVDGAFNGPAELSLRLADSAQFRRCFTQQLWRFAEGRAAAPGDERDVDELAEAFARADRRIDDLMLALVSRPNFVLRLPGEAAP
jgi:hypothetical protein